MNSKLLDARRKFKGQTATLTGGGSYDNSPFTEGVQTFEVVESMLKEVTRKGAMIPVHYLRIKCVVGEDENKSAFPFGPDLSAVDGIVASAVNIRAILGDRVPGRTNNQGTFDVDIAAFLELFDDLAHECIGEMIEVKVSNGKSTKDDGTPWQNFYIQRGLGEDQKGVNRDASLKAQGLDPKDDLNFGPASASRSGPASKKKVVKKKVTRKKVAKKKARKR